MPTVIFNCKDTLCDDLLAAFLPPASAPYFASLDCLPARPPLVQVPVPLQVELVAV